MWLVVFLLVRRPPGSTISATRFPFTSLCRSSVAGRAGHRCGRSAPVERGLATVEECGGTFAHVFGGEHQAELSGLIGHAFLDSALATVIDAIEQIGRAHV